MNKYKIINEFEAQIINGEKISAIYDSGGNVAQLLQWFLSGTKLKKHEYEAAIQHNLEETCLLKIA